MDTIDLNKMDEQNAGSTGSDFFSIPEGDTKLRVLTDFVKVEQVWEGVYPNSKSLGFKTPGQMIGANQSVKTSGWAWCLIKGEELKIVKFPMSLIAKLANLKKTEDYYWDEMPMPYDITIHNTGEGGDRYSITPARNNVPVSEEVLADLEQKTPIKDIIQKIKDKQTGVKVEIDYPESKGDPAF